MNPLIQAAVKATHEGRYSEALDIVQQLFGQIDRGETPGRAREFMVMFQWQLLVEKYPPARAAMVVTRDEQAKRLLAGELEFSHSDGWPRSRFRIVESMNEILGDGQSTYRTFVELDRHFPEYARENWTIAIEDVVAAGDFSLADRYMQDPMRYLDELNENAKNLPLIPPSREAPRLAADLGNFASGIRLRALVLEGLGRADEAAALRSQGLAGIESPELRELVELEISEPGTIRRKVLNRHVEGGDA